MNNEQIKITYCAQTLVFEKDAYNDFQDYEKGLKDFFLKQEHGQEIFDDLQLRICEMLQMRMKASGGVLNQLDVDFVKTSIGYAEQLEGDDEVPFDEAATETETNERKKLYRDETSKMIGGVSSGLGNYFSIDPLAFRLLFILTAILTKGFGLVAYAVFWIVLKPKHLEPNYIKRLFRNPNDKIIAGVCGGIATFFKTEAWIIRVIFLAPLLLNFLGDFSGFNIHLFNGSAFGLSIIFYIVLWITTKDAETPTENLLAKGEHINVNSVSAKAKASNENPDSNSSFHSFLRVIALIVIVFAIIGLFIILSGLGIASMLAFPMVSGIFDTQLLRWLTGLSLVFFVLLPFIAFVIWAVRRMAGIKGPNKPLRLTFGGLWALGFAAAITLAVLIGSQANKSQFAEQRISLPVQGDTLYVKNLESDFLKETNTGTNFIFQNLYSEDATSRKSNIVKFRQEPSLTDSFYARIKIESYGKSINTSNKSLGDYRTEFKDNTFYMSKYVSVPKDQPYRFQQATVTVYVPEGKVLISKRKKKGLTINNEGIYINNDDEDWEIKVDDNGVKINGGKGDKNISIDADDEIGLKQAEKRAEKEADMKIKIEKQRLKLKKEELRLEELKKQVEEML